MSLTPFYMDPLNETEKITPYKLFNIWISESFEIFVVLVIFKVILEKPITSYPTAIPKHQAIMNRNNTSFCFAIVLSCFAITYFPKRKAAYIGRYLFINRINCYRCFKYYVSFLYN